MKRFLTTLAIGITVALIGTMNSYAANDVSIDTAKEHLKAEQTEYVAAMNELFDSEDWAFSYIREFLEEKSWDSLIRARIACQLAASHIQDIEVIDSLSDEECTLLAKNNIDYQSIPLAIELFESFRDGELTSFDVLFNSLIATIDYQDELDLLAEHVDLHEEFNNRNRYFNDIDSQYCLAIIDDPNKPQKSAEELETELNSAMDKIEEISPQLSKIEAKYAATTELFSEKMVEGDLQWFRDNAVNIEGVPKLLSYPEWFAPEDFEYIFYTRQEDGSMNRFEYGDDLEKEMSTGDYYVFIQGEPIDAKEIDDYVTSLKKFVTATTRKNDTWVIIQDTYSLRIDLTEDDMSILIQGTDIPFSLLFFLTLR